jgi:predicted alpha/beta superfamily hydrolase
METTATSAPSAEMALNARVIDFTSKVNGRAYRLFVSIPTRRPTPPEGHAVIYLIDGNLHFGIAVDTMRIQACWPDVRDAVVVGIGYPTDRMADALGLRMQDLTTPITEAKAEAKAGREPKRLVANLVHDEEQRKRKAEKKEAQQ